MMLWTVMGRPTTLPVKMFANLPLDAVLAADEVAADDFQHFKAYSRKVGVGRVYKYTLYWPRLEGDYRAIRWKLTPTGQKYSTSCTGSFPEVMDAIRTWTYAELTEAGSGQARDCP